LTSNEQLDNCATPQNTPLTTPPTTPGSSPCVRRYRERSSITGAPSTDTVLEPWIRSRLSPRFVYGTGTTLLPTGVRQTSGWTMLYVSLSRWMIPRPLANTDCFVIDATRNSRVLRHEGELACREVHHAL